jgi:hypothetical protein
MQVQKQLDMHALRQEGMHRRLGINVKQKARNIWYSYTQMQLVKHEQLSYADRYRSMQLVKHEQISWAGRYRSMQLVKHEQISWAGRMQLVKHEQISWAGRYRSMQLVKKGYWTHAQKRQAYMDRGGSSYRHAEAAKLADFTVRR